jgi:hypothetical protein
MSGYLPNYPRIDGVEFTPVQLIAAAAQGTGNSVPPLTTTVKVVGVTTNADDFIVLPSLASCPDGHRITVLCSAASNFEIRTPASSGEEINSEDCDGTKELLATDTTIITITKINNTIGWMSEVRTAIGAYGTAVVPD